MMGWIGEIKRTAYLPLRRVGGANRDHACPAANPPYKGAENGLRVLV